MRTLVQLSRLSAVALFAASVLFAAMTLCASTPSARVCECANDDNPVICKGGVIYPNPCVASCFGARGCKHYGG